MHIIALYIDTHVCMLCIYIRLYVFFQLVKLILILFSKHWKNYITLSFPCKDSKLMVYLFLFIFWIFFELYFLYSRFLSVILWYFIHISVYMSIPISQFIPLTPAPPTFPPWYPYVCSLHLCLYLCLVNWFICSIFLDSTYMH